MTRTSNLNRADCTGTGAITPIPINFPFAAATDLIVYQLDTSNVQTTLTLNVDYTVAGAGTTSGTVTPVAAIPSGYHWTVLREVDQTQETDIRNQGAYYPEIIEDALDKLTDITQQLSERMDRAVTAAPTSTTTLQLPSGQVGYALGWPVSADVLGAVPSNVALALSDFASSSSAAKGAGMVGVGDGIAYTEGTAGERIVRLDKTITTAGTAPAFTLTPATPLTAYVAGQRFRVKPHASGTAPTLNVSGLGAVAIKHFDCRGSKIPTTVFANVPDDVEFDGTDHVARASHLPRALGAYRNYRASCTGLSASILMAADLCSVRDANGGYIELAAVSLTLATATSGANGLDTGTLAASTWYHKYVIYNPTTGTVAALCSLSATAPTLPSGYTHWMRMGAFRTDATANKYPLSCVWANDQANYKMASGSNVATGLLMSSGVKGNTSTPTWVAVSTATFVPPTATKIQVSVHCNPSSSVMVAPNNAYGGISGANPGVVQSVFPASTQMGCQATITLESTSIYCASTGTNYLMCLGWTDSI